MSTDRTHEDIRELLGVFALDAVDDAERRLVEEHLRTCDSCRREVDEHRASIAAFVPTGDPAPEGLWDRITASLEEEAAAPAVELPTARRPRRRWVTAIASLATAAAVAAIGFLGLQVAEQQREIARLTTALEQDAIARAAQTALDDPRAIEAVLATPEGEEVAQVVLLPDGEGFLIPHDLPALDDAHTYQLWVVSDEKVISAGVLGPSPDVQPFVWDGPVEAFVLTREVAGGVESSAGDVAAVGEVS